MIIAVQGQVGASVVDRISVSDQGIIARRQHARRPCSMLAITFSACFRIDGIGSVCKGAQDANGSCNPAKYSSDAVMKAITASSCSPCRRALLNAARPNVSRMAKKLEQA